MSLIIRSPRGAGYLKKVKMGDSNELWMPASMNRRYSSASLAYDDGPAHYPLSSGAPGLFRPQKQKAARRRPCLRLVF